MKTYFKSILFGLCLVSQSCAQSENESFSLETVFETRGVIWGFDFISTDELLVSIRQGRLLYVNLRENSQKELPIPQIAVTGQGGLLDVHYKTINNINYIYLTHSANIEGQLTTVLSRGILKNGTIDSYETLFVAKVKGSSGRHFGSRIIFKDNYIFMTIGDRGQRDYAQNLSYHNGKILRLDYLGHPVQGNPFETSSNALPDIWSYGHRNPQGIALEPVTSKLYSCEFGPRGGDELNLIDKRKNYGWPVITYGREYSGPEIGTTHNPNMEQPVTYWVPSISPSGMVFYEADKIPEWKNSLFLANLSSTHLRRLVLKDGKVTKQEVLFENLHERIRHVRNGLDGYLYISTDSGKLIKVSLRK